MPPWGDFLIVTLRSDMAEYVALGLAGFPFTRTLTSRSGLLVSPHDTAVAVIVWIFVASYAVARSEEPSAQVERQSAPITTPRTMPVPLASDGVPAT